MLFMIFYIFTMVMAIKIMKDENQSGMKPTSNFESAFRRVAFVLWGLWGFLYIIGRILSERN